MTDLADLDAFTAVTRARSFRGAAAGFDAGIRYEERLERDMIAAPIGLGVPPPLRAFADFIRRPMP